MKEEMMLSVRKTLKTLVRSAQNRLTSNEIFPDNNHKISLFLPIDFRKVCPVNSHENSADFSANLPLKIL